MKKVFRQVFHEFLWLTISLTITFLLAVFLFGWTFLKSELSYWLPLILLFFVVTFIMHSIKEVQKNGENKQIIYAMISNLQTRISFLQTVLKRIEENENLKNTTDEKTL